MLHLTHISKNYANVANPFGYFQVDSAWNMIKDQEGETHGSSKCKRLI